MWPLTTNKKRSPSRYTRQHTFTIFKVRPMSATCMNVVLVDGDTRFELNLEQLGPEIDLSPGAKVTVVYNFSAKD